MTGGRMEPQQAMAAIEAILFTMGESVEVAKLADVIEGSREETRRIIHMLEDKYTLPESGLVINWYEDSVQLSTKEEQFENLVKIARNPRKATLTDTMMETLSIIAYKQPVTRMEIEGIRGVNCDFAINKLMGYDLIRELGRKDAPGHPLLFGTTEQFLRSFGLRSLQDLPSLNAVKAEEFKEEAQQEIDTRLNI